MSVERLHVLVLAVLAAPVCAGPAHVVELANGDHFQGQVLSFSPDGEMRVTHENFLEPMRVQGKALKDFYAHPGARIQPPADPVVVRLRNGDSLPAKVESFDGTTLALSTTWGGDFKLPWAKVAQLEFTGGTGKVIFSGPADDQPWRFLNRGGRTGSDKWSLHSDGAGGGQPGGAAVDAGLPDRVEAEFDIEWTTSLNFGIGLFADSFLPEDDKEPNGATVFDAVRKQGQLHPHLECLALDLSSHSVSLQTHSQHNQNVVGNARLPEPLYQKNRARVLVRADRQAGTIALWVNGAFVERWDQIGPFPGKGHALSFWQYHDNGSVRVKKLVVREWDGRTGEEVPKAETGKDIILGGDGSRLSGRLLKIEKEEWYIKTDVAQMAMPASKIRHIISPAPDPNAKKAPEAGFLATIEGGFKLSLEAPALADERLSGRHDVLGPVGIPMNNLQRFEVLSKAKNSANSESSGPDNDP